MSPRAPHRFYYAGHIDHAGIGQSLQLAAAESRHLLRVLRLKPGTLIDIFDAGGQAWSAEVEPGSTRDVAQVRLIAPIFQEENAAAPLNLAVSVLKRRAMDWLLEKLSELGVDTLQPVLSARSIGYGDFKLDSDPPERWERLALAAAKQCGRNRPLATLPPTQLREWLARPRPPAHTAFAHTGVDAQPLGAWLREQAGVALPIWLVIGPEGGWTPEEVEAFIHAGFRPVTLGNLTLRAETAALAAAACCRLA
jgi:16S rRNA (uracil1498-N3)-methyltransferase